MESLSSEKENSFKSTISVPGKWFAFLLAEGLNKKGFLDKLFTPYPYRKIVNGYQIDKKKVKTFYFFTFTTLLRTRFKLEFSPNVDSFLFDNWVALKLKKPSKNWIFHSWAGFAKNSIAKAKKLGAITVLERSCPHIDFQEQITKEEEERLLGIKIVPKKCPICEKMKEEYEMADFIFVPSKYSYKSFIERGFSPEKVKIVSLSNEKRTEFKDFDKEDFKGKFTVLSIGGNFFRKGLYYLAKAWRSLDLDNAELVIKASIPKQFKNLFRGKNIKLIEKHLTDQEIANLYKKASIFILPSIDDGFGMVVVEAMASGLPVIVTENVGASDTIEQGKEGFVVPIRDVGALKEKILYFYKNREELKKMSEMAFVKAKEYTPEKYLERVLRTYRSILNK